jgi:hypothetical protein
MPLRDGVVRDCKLINYTVVHLHSYNGFLTERGVVPLLDPSADKLMRLGGRWSGRSLTLVLSESFDGVYRSRLSVESDLSILITNFKYSEIKFKRKENKIK